ncbi:unnamed protein product [Cunninghamella echinulata]
MNPLTSKDRKVENKTNKISQNSIKTKQLRIGLSNKDRNKEEEMTKEKIALWRSYAQSIADSLYPYYQEYKSSVYWYGDHLMYYNSTNNTEDDMSKMLRDLHIDPETIHYSSVIGDYY